MKITSANFFGKLLRIRFRKILIIGEIINKLVSFTQPKDSNLMFKSLTLQSRCGYLAVKFGHSMGQEFTTFIGKVHYRNAVGARLFALAAALCVDRARFDEAMSAHFEVDGGALLWSEEVFSVVDWLRKFGHNGDVMTLARKVCEAAPVAMSEGKAEIGMSNDDFLVIDEIKGVEPLDAQLGVWPKLMVPEALQEVMFGEPEPTATERVAHGDVPPPMRTYAILDAAKYPFMLTSYLEDSGLEYQSLFQGDALEDLGEYAPYIVRLEEDNDFARKLFTTEKAMGLWEKELGIFVRSRASLAELRKHFRKFTRIQDEAGRWYYFRFWEGVYLIKFLRKTSIQNVHVLHGQYVSEFITLSSASATISKVTPNGQIENSPATVRLSRPDIELFSSIRVEKFANALKSWLQSSYGHMRNIPRDKVSDFLIEQIQVAKDKIGLTNEKVIAEYVATSWLLEKSAYQSPELKNFHFGNYFDAIHEIHQYAASIRDIT